MWGQRSRRCSHGHGLSRRWREQQAGSPRAPAPRKHTPLLLDGDRVGSCCETRATADVWLSGHTGSLNKSEGYTLRQWSFLLAAVVGRRSALAVALGRPGGDGAAQGFRRPLLRLLYSLLSWRRSVCSPCTMASIQKSSSASRSRDEASGFM